MELNYEAIRLVKLSKEEVPDLTAFNCGAEEMNRFFQEEAFEEQEKGLNTTILLYYKGDLAAACSICCDAITLSNDEKEEAELPYAKVPAIKIARLGRILSYKNYAIGKFLVEYIKNIAYRLNEDSVGVRFLTLDAYQNKVDYYKEELGFTENQAKKIKPDRPVSMRADVFE